VAGPELFARGKLNGFETFRILRCRASQASCRSSAAGRRTHRFGRIHRGGRPAVRSRRHERRAMVAHLDITLQKVAEMALSVLAHR
jgi:hypothetical protein